MKRIFCRFCSKQQKLTLRTESKQNTRENQIEIENKKKELQDNFENRQKILEEDLFKLDSNYKAKMAQLEADLELRLRVDIHELEERKNLHINMLIKTFEKKINDWKQENINQTKDNVNLIHTNNERLKKIREENDKLIKEVDKLNKEINELDNEKRNSEEELRKLDNKLAKFYNQEINMKNMSKKIAYYKEKIEEVNKRTKQIEIEKEALTLEIRNLKGNFEKSVLQYRERAEFKNDLLNNKINELYEKFIKMDIEMEEIFGTIEEADVNLVQTQKNQLENIRMTLESQTRKIKDLNYHVSLYMKAYNDTIRVYENKLISFGVPAEEITYQLLESNTSKMPAGLVAD